MPTLGSSGTRCPGERPADGFTTAHSHVFQFSKAARYFFDADAVREPAEWARWGDQTVPKYAESQTSTGWMQPRTKGDLQAARGRGYAGRLGNADRRSPTSTARSRSTTRRRKQERVARRPAQGGLQRSRCQQSVEGHQQAESDSPYVNPGGRSTNGIKERSDERRGFDQRLELIAGKNHRSFLDIPTSPNGLAICEVCGAYWERGAPMRSCLRPAE